MNSVGIVTARDALTIHKNENNVLNTINRFIAVDGETARQYFNLGKDARDWIIDLAQEDIRQSGVDKNNIVPILYHHLIKISYYTGKSRGFHCMPRPEVMQNMLKSNLALATVRQCSVKFSDMFW